MRGTFDGEPTDYGRGFAAGLLTAFGLLGAGVVTDRAVEWALANPVGETAVAWATTPAITPLDVATVVVGLLALYLVLVAVVSTGIGRKA